ncbi:MAG: diacylglycerol kinase family protein [Actinomycetaceae bacterium]|nr:diacylglycerol kinase family protein [Actinomycetaceae bacterium]
MSDLTPYVIYNPVKVSKAYRLRKLVTLGAVEAGMAEPVWMPTTVSDPGTGQAAQAVAEGAALVIAAGGDGTVRAVAAGMAHSKIPMAVLPFGTGNLLARNLSIPTDDLQEAVDIAFFGLENEADLGWIRVSDVEEKSELPPEGSLLPEPHLETLQKKGVLPPSDDEYAFLVISGQGWDAELMAGTSSELKKHVGWGAYVVAGAQSLRAPQTTAHVTLDGDKKYTVTSRSLLFANCSTLTAGVVLVPDAKINDGLIDVTILDAKAGIIGWMDLFTKILVQGVGMRPELLPGTTGNLAFKKAKTAHTTADTAQPIQVDGDAIGSARTIDVRVDYHALRLRRG